MNATEEMGECYIRFKKRTRGRHRINSTKFQDRFVLKPCQACGSDNHSLLRKVSETIEANPIRYEYECGVIEPTPLYPEGDIDNITIKYFMSTSKFAEECIMTGNIQVKGLSSRERTKRIGTVFSRF